MLVFIQQSVPNTFGESDEAWLLSVLGEMLHPSSSTSYLSEQYVKEIEGRPGYLELLLVLLLGILVKVYKIVYNSANYINILQLAIICIKNCVTRRWWKHQTSKMGNYLSEDEKSHLLNVIMANVSVY